MLKSSEDIECMSCGDMVDFFDVVYVSPKFTDKPGYRCVECAHELITGVVTNQNVHIVGAPETPKVNKLVNDWE